MARKYLTPIDLTGLELTNFKVQNLSSNPSAYGKGHTYFNTSANELRVYDGSAWVAVGGNVESGTLVQQQVTLVASTLILLFLYCSLTMELHGYRMA